MKTNLKSKLNNKKSLIAAVLLFVFMLSICTGAYVIQLLNLKIPMKVV